MGSLSRRGLLRLAGGATLGTIALTATGCGTGSAAAGREAQQRLTDHMRRQRPDPTGRAEVVGDPDLEADLTFWGWANDVPRKISEEFRRYFPRVRFNFVDLSHEATHRKLQLSLHAGSAAPDLTMLSDPQGPRFWDLGLLDLTAGLRPYEESFPRGKWEQVSRPDGTLQGVPWDGGPTTMIYRRDVFERYAVDPAAITTWDDFIEVGRKLATDSGGRTHLMQSNAATNTNGINQSTTIGQFELFCQLSGGRWFDRSGRTRLTEDDTVRALKLTRRLRTAGIARTDLGSAQAEFDVLRTGAVATYLAPIWLKQTLIDNAPETKGRWGAIRLPAFDADGPRAADLTGSSVAITDQSRHPIAAWEFLRFWLLRVDQRIASYRVGGLFENVFAPAAEHPFFREPDPFFSGTRWLEVNSAVARSAPRFQPGKDFDAVKLEVETRMPDFLAGRVPAEQMLAESEKATRK